MGIEGDKGEIGVIIGESKNDVGGSLKRRSSKDSGKTKSKKEIFMVLEGELGGGMGFDYNDFSRK